MSPTPPSTDPSTGARSPEEQFRVVRKRNRVPLSCYPCRTRKKCDRCQPCSNCTRREGMDTQSCSYAAPVTRKKNQSQGESSPDDMQNRIDRLEGLVLSLMHGGANPLPANEASSSDPSTSQAPTDSGSSAAKVPLDTGAEMPDGDDGDASDVENDLATSLGVLKVDADKGKSMYFGQEHWHTILADISEVKQYFNTHKKELESSYERVRASKPTTAQEGPTLLLGATPASEIELRAELPSKTTVLRLCSRYFNSMDNAVSIIHGPTFQEQLRNHWKDPSKTPIAWLGLLYSVLCLAMFSYSKVGDEPPEWKGRSLEMASEFRLRTVQCLIKSDYTKPVDYTIETMILYVYGEYQSRFDADVGLWMLTSLIVRIAFRQGYHRDAKWFPSITPFQAEMRRRTWALLRMSDVMFSHQVSLPNMIYDHDCDTQLPTNIFDEEIYPDIKEPPAPRPSTEPTPIAYMIAKARLCNEAGSVLQATHRVGKHVSYDEVLRHDAKLRQIKQELPPHLKVMLPQASPDPVTLIIARYNIDILYNKILCVLHRKYLPRARHNSRYAHSRRSAIEASLSSLDHLAILFKETQGDGRLRSIAWYIKSVATKDFTLPAMLVIMDLHFDNVSRQKTGNAPQGDGAFLYTDEQRADMLNKVETAKNIWKSLADTSMEAFKASKVLEIMLAKVKNPQQANLATPAGTDPMEAFVAEDLQMPPLMPQDSSSSGDLGGFTGTMPAFQSGGTNDFMGMDFGLSPSTMANFPASNDFSQSATDPMALFNVGGMNGQSTDFNTNFDWNMLENFTQGAPWGADQSFQLYGGADESSPENRQGTSFSSMSGNNSLQDRRT